MCVYLAKPATLTAEVLDAEGSVVRTLPQPGLRSGQQQVVWDGRHSDGSRMARGSYRIRLQARDEQGRLVARRFGTVKVVY